MARALSSQTGAALLDLTQVPVSTRSLVGLLTDFAGQTDAIEAFHAGKLPLIVDALDEGRLLSGEKGFEQFLETSGELLNESRAFNHAPKLIFLGRPDSIELAKLGLQLACEAFTHTTLEVSFFAEPSARNLIDLYAQKEADPDSAYLQHPRPANELIDAYFKSIESALGIPKGTLWQSDAGRAFAGYAPVLAALGTLLAKFDNFLDIKNELELQGPQQAWAVIELVLNAILERERLQFVEQLRKRIAVQVPAEAYDKDEQLTLLVKLIHGYKPLSTGKVKLSGSDLQIYQSMVSQRLHEHPFIRHDEPANDVLGSLILAHAVVNDSLRFGDNSRLGPLSRQPFLWRSLGGMLQKSVSLLDGKYLGYLLNSLWNDPIGKPHRKVIVRSTSEELSALAIIPIENASEVQVEVMLPLGLYGQARNCSIDINGHLKLYGDAIGSGGGTFIIRGPVDILCSSLEVEADVITFDNSTWLEAETVTSRPRLELSTAPTAQVGWGGALATTFPWNQQSISAEPPYASPHQDLLESLLRECSRRLPVGATITLRPNYTNPEDERLNWIDREFKDAFAQLIGAMIRHGLATQDNVPAKGEAKIHIRFNSAWQDVFNAFKSGGDPKYGAFLEDARKLINR